MTKNVALLPMKANSERVKGKNFKNFKGKPLFRWVLDTLLGIDQIDKVIINTDAIDLLESYNLPVSEKIIVRQRSADLCGDFVSMNLIIEDDIKAISAENYLMTHTTNPLIAAKTFENALSEFQKLDKEEHNSLFSVNAYQSRFYTASANPVNHDPNNLIRTQDLPPLFEENSCIYLFNKESFYSTNARIGSKPKLFTTPFFESVDIDDEKSWALAELYFDYLMSQKS